jgi:superfamily II RNA helicase
MCVEDLLEAGLVRLVCATTTLAAGLDVPARTVLLSTLYRNSPAGPEALTPTEFHQMTGRAGRRGRDTLGVAVIAVETSAEAEEGMALASAAPDPVVSAFMPSDAQVLNLLARAPLRDAESLLGRSLAAFQRRPEIAAVRARLAALPADPLTTRPCGDRLATRSRFEHLLRELRRARRGNAGAQAEIAQLGRAILEMPCTGCPAVERCLASLRDLRAVEHSRRLLGAELAELEEREVRVFHRRAGILRALGYLDEGWRLTAHGRVAARIRHPRMLIIAEAMRARVLPSDPSALAAVAGALGSERAGPPTPPRHGRRLLSRSGRPTDLYSPGPRVDPALQEARSALVALRDIVIAINGRRRRAGLPEDPLEGEFAPAGGGPAAVYQRAAVVGAWATGGEWETITARHRIPEGDLQRLIWQAAEILAQFEDLPGGPLPAIAGTARRTMLRTPVL